MLSECDYCLHQCLLNRSIRQVVDDGQMTHGTGTTKTAAEGRMTETHRAWQYVAMMIMFSKNGKKRLQLYV